MHVRRLSSQLAVSLYFIPGTQIALGLPYSTYLGRGQGSSRTPPASSQGRSHTERQHLYLHGTHAEQCAVSALAEVAQGEYFGGAVHQLVTRCVR